MQKAKLNARVQPDAKSVLTFTPSTREAAPIEGKQKPAKVLPLAPKKPAGKPRRKASKHDIESELVDLVLGSELSFDDLLDCLNVCMRFIKLKADAVKHPRGKSRKAVKIILLLQTASDETIHKIWLLMQEKKGGSGDKKH